MKQQPHIRVEMPWLSSRTDEMSIDVMLVNERLSCAVDMVASVPRTVGLLADIPGSSLDEVWMLAPRLCRWRSEAQLCSLHVAWPLEN